MTNIILQYILTILSIVIGASLTLLSNYALQKKKNESEQKQLFNVLLGELLTIQEHYITSKNRLSEKHSSKEDFLLIKMAYYGDLSFSGKDLSKIGFLEKDDIKEIIQISLHIRNIDYYIKYIEENNLNEYSDNYVQMLNILNRMDSINTRVSKFIINISKKGI